MMPTEDGPIALARVRVDEIDDVAVADSNGEVGVRIIPILIRNGPGITVSGLADGETVHGDVAFRVNVFSATEPFEPRRAESRSPTPVWVFVLGLAVAGFSMWYLAEEWNPPPDIASTPTYAASPAP